MRNAGFVVDLCTLQSSQSSIHCERQGRDDTSETEQTVHSLRIFWCGTFVSVPFAYLADTNVGWNTNGGIAVIVVGDSLRFRVDDSFREDAVDGQICRLTGVLGTKLKVAFHR